MSRTCGGLLCLALAFSPAAAHAAAVASDSAADPVYNDGWQPGDNGGTGWAGGWTFRNQSNTVLTTSSGARGWFVGDSRGNNDPNVGDSNGDFDINAGGRAWGVYSNSNDQVYAIRPLNGTLSVGQSISWEMDNGLVNGGQVVGLRFLSDANDVNSRVFEARFVGGDSNYSLIATPNALTSIGYTREGLYLEYTLTSPTTFSLKIDRLVNNGSVTQTLTGTNLTANAIAAIAFKNQFAGGGGGADAFVNNIAVLAAVPEASAAQLCAVAMLPFAAAVVGTRVLRARRHAAQHR